MTNTKAPSVNEISFNCPHCGALAQQFWSELAAIRMDKDGHPQWFRDDLEEFMKTDEGFRQLEVEERENLLKLAARLNSEEVFLEGHFEPYKPPKVRNLHLSRCYSCDQFAVWIGRKLVHPRSEWQFLPSPDMPAPVKKDYEEANAVFLVSPRASAALLRVAIEKLCNEINKSDDSVFEGIGKLVKKGLDEKVQRALDIVRVTGNEAVHPGQIDFNDTPETAQRLFKLVNIIVERLITLPKEIDDVYDGLPEDKRKAIENRDKNKRAP